MTEDPRDPRDPRQPAAPPSETSADGALDAGDAGYVPPDPDEPPPVELARVGDVLPWGTVVILLVWGVVFFWFAVRRQTELLPAYLAWGANVGGRPPLETAWRLLASTFLHAGMAHVGFNALSMMLFGSSVESVFSRWAFWIVYAFGGSAASLGSLAWHAWRYGDATHTSVGGSGAIFALGGALLASAIRLRTRLAVGRARALAAGALFLLGQSLVAGFSHLGTDNAAHAAGLVSGFGIGNFMPISVRLGGRPAPWAVRFVGAIAVVAVLAAIAIAVASGASARY